MTKSYPSRLVTVTSCDYLPGTAVMLHSFLRTNRWFSGTIRILHNDLDEAQIARLASLWPQMEFCGITPDLADAVEALCGQRDHLASRARRFYSLDAFCPGDGETVIFCDGDLLFLDDISGFATNPAMLVACGDRAQIEGHRRDPVTLEECTGPGPDAGFRSFNAGLMLIDPALRTTTIWQSLLGNLQAEQWDTVQSSHTDQAVLNRVFGDRVTLADIGYNYLVGHAARLRESTGIPLAQAKVLHFNNRTKPWLFDHHESAVQADAATIRAFERWFAAYTHYLTHRHFALQEVG